MKFKCKIYRKDNKLFIDVIESLKSSETKYESGLFNVNYLNNKLTRHSNLWRKCSDLSLESTSFALQDYGRQGLFIIKGNNYFINLYCDKDLYEIPLFEKTLDQTFDMYVKFFSFLNNNFENILCHI